MSRRAALALLGLTLGCAPASTHPPESTAPIVIDGDFADWQSAPVLSSNDHVPEAKYLDLREVRGTADGARLHLMFVLGEVTNLQMMNGTLRLVLDGDGASATGEEISGLVGADMLLDFSFPNGSGSRQGIMLRMAGDTSYRTSYDVHLEYAPTHASDRFEIRLRREPGGALAGRRVGGRLAAIDVNNQEVDALGPFALNLPQAEARSAPVARDVLVRSPRTDLRIVTWNVGSRTPLLSPDPFRRMMSAAAPDVILLDELAPAIDAAALRALLPESGAWEIVLGTGGGRQRTAVASRLPLESAPSLQHAAYPDSLADLVGLPMVRQMEQDLRTAERDGIPTTGAIVTERGKRILLVPLDFMCCGALGGAEDRARIMTADAVQKAVREAIRALDLDGVIVGGDLNLVGSRLPLDVLLRGLDPAGGDLEPVAAVTPDRESVSTWRSPGPFPPGRLDWILFSPSSLELVGAFVFNGAALEGAGLDPNDAAVTDHLPVVADLRVKR
jgi:endonuclease/exonuclease/phosphatase family metal-dependent hydrolase